LLHLAATRSPRRGPSNELGQNLSPSRESHVWTITKLGALIGYGG
jgi:hypothetical protein